MENSIAFTLLLGLAVGHLSFILKHTDFIIEYGKLVYPEEFFRIKEYNQWKEGLDEEHDYPGFIRDSLRSDNKYKNWLIKLFGCPYCFSTFLCIVLSFLYCCWYFILIGLSSAAIASIIYSIEIFLYKKNNIQK